MVFSAIFFQGRNKVGASTRRPLRPRQPCLGVMLPLCCVSSPVLPKFCHPYQLLPCLDRCVPRKPPHRMLAPLLSGDTNARPNLKCDTTHVRISVISALALALELQRLLHSRPLLRLSETSTDVPHNSLSTLEHAMSRRTSF